MRLFTHNFLQCHVKGCTQSNYPLRISEAEVETRETEMNEAFLNSFLCKLDWPALLTTVSDLGMQVELPQEKPEEPLSAEAAATLHRVLLETYVRSGKMTCDGCGKVFPVKDGIPNMLLAEDEV